MDALAGVLAGGCMQELFIQRRAVKYLALFPAWANSYQATSALLCNAPGKFFFGRELLELKYSKLAAHKAGERHYYFWAAQREGKIGNG